MEAIYSLESIIRNRFMFEDKTESRGNEDFRIEELPTSASHEKIDECIHEYIGQFRVKGGNSNKPSDLAAVFSDKGKLVTVVCTYLPEHGTLLGTVDYLNRT